MTYRVALRTIDERHGGLRTSGTVSGCATIERAREVAYGEIRTASSSVVAASIYDETTDAACGLVTRHQNAERAWAAASWQLTPGLYIASANRR